MDEITPKLQGQDDQSINTVNTQPTPTPSPSPKRIAIRLTVDAVMLALCYLALYTTEHNWAANLFSFFTVLFAAMHLVYLSQDARVKTRAAGQSVPRWYDRLVDLALITGCAATGSFWLAAAWVWMAIASMMVHDGGSEE